VGIGGDDTLFAKVAGVVSVDQRGGNRYVSITPAA
jgi:ribosomal protein L27